MSRGGYAEKGSDGKRRYTLPAGFGSYAQEGGDAVLSELQPRNEWLALMHSPLLRH